MTSALVRFGLAQHGDSSVLASALRRHYRSGTTSPINSFCCGAPDGSTCTCRTPYCRQYNQSTTCQQLPHLIGVGGGGCVPRQPEALLPALAGDAARQGKALRRSLTVNHHLRDRRRRAVSHCRHVHAACMLDTHQTLCSRQHARDNMQETT